MRIAIITSEFPLVSETFIIDHVISLMDRGHDVTIFASKIHEDCPHEVVAQRGLMRFVRPIDPCYSHNIFVRMIRRIKMLLTESWRNPALTIRSLNPRLFGRAAFILSGFACVRGFADSGQFDIVHCHFGWSGALGARLKKAGAIDAPLIVTFHGSDVNTSWGINLLGDREFLFKNADWFTANTNFTRKQAIELGGPVDRFSIWHMGVDLNRFQFKERRLTDNEPIRLLTVGRLVENKGIDFSIRALKLIDSRRAIEFHVVGDGPLRGPLSRLANEIGSGKTVIFHGSCSSAQVRKHLDKAHLFILAAVTSADGAQEGQSVALIEAQACGLPILSTFHGGIPEAVVNGASGFLVPERDIDSLSDRLRYLIENSEEWSAMGIAGRRFVEESFSLQSCSDKITNIYGSLISEHDRTAAHR